MSRNTKWNGAVELHARAAAALEATAAAVPPERWNKPFAPGKWSPAEVVQHLVLAYEVLLRELGGGGGMALRTRWWQRLLLWYTLRPRLLAGKPFPKGARAPREVRPETTEQTQEDARARFVELSARFAGAMEDAHRDRPRTRLTHAYFGAQPLEEVLRFVAAHLRHHDAQLRQTVRPASAAQRHGSEG